MQEEISSEDKIKNFFNKIAVLELEPEDKQKIAVNTKEHSK